MDDRNRFLLPLATEFLELLGDQRDVQSVLSDECIQRLQMRARSVYAALGDSSSSKLASAVEHLVHECVTLPEHIKPNESAGCNSAWAFGPAVAEAAAAAVAAAAGLREPGLLSNGSSVDLADVFQVLEGLARHLDCLAPHLFSGLCRIDEHSICNSLVGYNTLPSCEEGAAVKRVHVALQGVCAWSLAAVGRTIGYDRLTAIVLWEWCSGDALWTLVLAKGALVLEKPPPNPFVLPTMESALAAPDELHELQSSVAEAVLGFAEATVAFHSELLGTVTSNGPDGGPTIEQRSAQLASHRASLASLVVETQLIGPLICTVASCASAVRAKLAAFLAALLQPELIHEDPPWANVSADTRNVLQDARKASASLRSSLGWHADDVWATLTSVSTDDILLHRFLEDCCRLAFAASVVLVQVAALLKDVISKENVLENEALLTRLCILASNAGLQPSHDTVAEGQDGGLASALMHLSSAMMSGVAGRLGRWAGPVKKDMLDAWLRLLGQPKQILACSVPPVIVDSASAPLCEARPSGLRQLLQAAPVELCCTADGRLLTDPVRTPSGHAFERSVLAKLLSESGGLCPITSQPLRLQDCPRDAALRLAALDWCRERRAAQQTGRPRRSGGLESATAHAGDSSDEPNYDNIFGL